MTVRDIALAFLAKEPEDWTWVDPEQIKALAEFVRDHTESPASINDSMRFEGAEIAERFWEGGKPVVG